MNIDVMVMVLEIIGILSFAVAGALVGIDQKMDAFGTTILGLITASGGGIIRDVCLGITPPGIFQSPLYIIIASLTAFFVYILYYFHLFQPAEKHKQIYMQLLWYLDALGLAMFTAVGVHIGIHHGQINNLFFLLFIGTVSGVGGSVIRDVIAKRSPFIFVEQVYAVASILGALICVIAYVNYGSQISLILSFSVTLIIRIMAMHYRWNMHA